MKIVIIGAGRVGISTAYTLLFKGQPDEILLLDTDKTHLEGEVIDLNHSLSLVNRPVIVSAGDYIDTASADIVIITAGIRRKPEDSRLDLVVKNAKLMGEIIEQITRYNTQSLIIVVTNPVDILTHQTLMLSKFSPKRVFGLGTLLDSIRFRSLLAKAYKVNSLEVNGYIIGEHGDSMVPIWSQVRIKGNPLSDDPEIYKKILSQIKGAGAELISKKGGAGWGVGIAIAEVVEAIIQNDSRILPVSSLVTDYYGINDVVISVPSIIDREGIKEHLLIPTITQEELSALKSSATILSNEMKKLDL